MIVGLAILGFVALSHQRETWKLKSDLGKLESDMRWLRGQSFLTMRTNVNGIMESHQMFVTNYAETNQKP